ncbi:hypothetical protein TRSC58_00891 [Trypanosoma rangeli SC58]|uniref:Uncharacterized protein n=1 Tax=Trypanosoma rangeli SC58 TaxID=429131 RepID=A0A061JAH1_TRYRA|nr:hypothetical protein TRSC58_00891 [Trypanosoma rangeli SC58]
MNIVPLERLSLTHSSVVQAVTGATPFHSLSEFVMWMKSIETGNVCVHVGEVEKVVTLNDGRIWIYGNGNIATVVVPIRNPFALNAIIRDCEHASHVACAILRGFAGHDLDSTGVYGAFFAEYLHHCYLLHCDKNKYHRKIVDVLRFTLLSHASNTGVPPDVFSHTIYFDLSKKAMDVVSSVSACCQPNRKKSDTAALAHAANIFEEGNTEGICRFAQLIWTAVDNASLLFCVKESI